MNRGLCRNRISSACAKASADEAGNRLKEVSRARVNMVKKLSIAVLLLLGIFFFVLAFRQSNPQKISPVLITKKESPKPTIKPTPILASQGTSLQNQSSALPTPVTSPLALSHEERQTSTSTPAPVSTATPTPTPAPVSLQVSLIINSTNVGMIALNDGANQCDVLLKALEQGKINSLNMRYDSNLGTNAVYQINGTGKENSVWWTYKVNGESPKQGCSYIKVNNGDRVEWSYLGN